MSRGIKRERQVKVILEADGWWVCRAAGSFGDADLVAIRRRENAHPSCEVRLIEVKSTLTPWSHFGPESRAELISAAVKTGATPVLAWWPKRGKLKWLPVSEWP